jgi:hypothetical protein
MALTYRRDLVVEAIVDKIQAITLDGDYTHIYRYVTRDPMGSDNIAKLRPGESCVGVYDINEEKLRQFGVTTATLTVIIEFYYMHKIGESKAQVLNRMLAELIRAITMDHTLNNTAINVEDIANNIDIDGIYDKIINGSITFHVKYRHGIYDPTKANC